MSGCEWDNETDKVDGFLKYGYNGDDFLTLDLQTLTWLAAKPQAETIKQEWDGNTARTQLWRTNINNIYPTILQKALKYGSEFLQRTGRELIYCLLSIISDGEVCVLVKHQETNEQRNCGLFRSIKSCNVKFSHNWMSNHQPLLIRTDCLSIPLHF